LDEWTNMMPEHEVLHPRYSVSRSPVDVTLAHGFLGYSHPQTGDENGHTPQDFAPGFHECCLSGPAKSDQPLLRTSVLDGVLTRNATKAHVIFESITLPDGTGLPSVLSIDGDKL
jgi:hypothetical protein